MSESMEIDSVCCRDKEEEEDTGNDDEVRRNQRCLNCDRLGRIARDVDKRIRTQTWDGTVKRREVGARARQTRTATRKTYDGMIKTNFLPETSRRGRFCDLNTRSY